MVILDEADEMTTDAQNALRRGKCHRKNNWDHMQKNEIKIIRIVFEKYVSFLFCSYGEVHGKHQILSHL